MKKKTTAEAAAPVVTEAPKAEVKETAAVAEKKETVKKAPAKKEAVSKTASPAAEEKAPAAEKKAPAKKAAASKSAAPATEEKASAAEKKAPARKTAAKKSTEVKAAVSVQFSGKEYTTEQLVEIAKAVWQYDLGQKLEDFKSVELYVKPEESAVYYVINGDTTGSFAI